MIDRRLGTLLGRRKVKLKVEKETVKVAYKSTGSEKT